MISFRKCIFLVVLSFFAGLLVSSVIFTIFNVHNKTLENNISLSSRENIIKYSTQEHSIPIVAVRNDGGGVVGRLHLRLIPGKGNILLNTNPFSEPDIEYSLHKAVEYAKKYTNFTGNVDFIFTYNVTGADLIGGGSAGAAATILTISSLLNKSLKNDSVITGTINPDGTIGPVGGILEKAYAVSRAGYKYFLIPKGQSIITYYEKVTQKEPIGYGFYLYNTYYVPKRINLTKVAREEWNLTVVEVSNIKEALKYFID